MIIYEKILELGKRNSSFVVVTVINVTGFAPGKIGFKMIVESDGSTLGTVGGGAIEKEAVKEALTFLTTGESQTKEYLLSDKADPSSGNVIPMSCNGKIELYYEVHGRNPVVYIFGGGHVGSALLHMLKPLPFHTILVDNREEFADFIKNPNATEIIHADYAEYVLSFNPAPESYFVVLTHGHEFDYAIMEALYERKIDAKYIGVISSKSKSVKMLSQLKKQLGKDVDISTLHMPIGIKLGGDSAAEIALAIAAEIQSVRFNKEISIDK